LGMPRRFKAFHRPFTLPGGLMRILGGAVRPALSSAGWAELRPQPSAARGGRAGFFRCLLAAWLVSVGLVVPPREPFTAGLRRRCGALCVYAIPVVHERHVNSFGDVEPSNLSVEVLLLDMRERCCGAARVPHRRGVP
jgi:hypothetical protein